MKKAAIEVTVKSRNGGIFKAGVIDLGKGRIVLWTAGRKSKKDPWEITTSPLFELKDQEQEERKWHELISSRITRKKRKKGEAK
ncbi:MAG: hypothetical protein Q8N84_04205 [bacterium]|nr:hypothetical protein [bacterium]